MGIDNMVSRSQHANPKPVLSQSTHRCPSKLVRVVPASPLLTDRRDYLLREASEKDKFDEDVRLCTAAIATPTCLSCCVSLRKEETLRNDIDSETLSHSSMNRRNHVSNGHGIVPSHQEESPSLFKNPVLTAPLSLDIHKADAGEAERQKGLLARILDVLKGVRQGGDLTKFQVPAQFNLPKSQLQVYGECVYCCAQDLLGKCAEGHTPLQRFLNVVAWHISTTRPAPFAKTPLNPVLGETHQVSCGDLNVLLEQVSHHPPITALYATNDVKQYQLQWWQQPVPRFYGSSVEATIQGRRTLRLLQHGEEYEMTCPKLLIRFFPSPGTEWVGSTTIQCPQSCLEATVTFKSREFFGLRGSQNKVAGKIYDRSTGHILYELNGKWDQKVMVKDTETGKTSTLYDAQAALTNLETPVVRNPSGLAPMESVVVWSTLMESIVDKDWDKARGAKLTVEERQRALRKQRDEAGISWSPKYFTAIGDHDWEWLHQGQSVPQASIVIPDS